MENKFCVYKHVTPSGKVYIGITSMEPLKRWKNGRGYEGCTAFWRAIQKYGWENIAHEILFIGLSKHDACIKEQEMIKYYDSANPDNGYNLTLGGDHYTFNKETAAHISNALKEAYKNHPEYREHLSKIQTGRKCSAQSSDKKRAAMLKLYEEHPEMKHRCGDSFRGKKRSGEFSRKLGERKSKAVFCIETQKRYRSIKEASEKENVPRTGITNMLSGRAKTCGGLTFVYA